MIRRILILSVLSVAISSQAGELELHDSTPAQWREALALAETGQSTEAVAAFVAIDKLERDPTPTPAAHLARYFILRELARLERFDDVAKRLPVLRRGLLPECYQPDALRLEAQALLETGRPRAALELLPATTTSGRLRLLRGRALAETEDTEAAVDTLADGLVAAHNASRQEQQAAVMSLLLLLGEQGQLAEAERLEQSFAKLGLAP